MTPLTINDPSFAAQPSTKISLPSPQGRDFSDLATNNDLHSSIQSIMLSNKTKDISKFFSKDSQDMRKIPTRPKNSQRNSVETVSRTSRNQSIDSGTGTPNQKMMVLQNSYQKALESCFNVLNQPHRPKRPEKEKNKTLGGHNSQPSSPVSKKSETGLFQFVIPNKPTVKLSEGLGVPISFEGLFTNRTTRNLKLTPSHSQQSSFQLNLKEPLEEMPRNYETIVFANAFERMRVLTERKSRPKKNLFEHNKNIEASEDNAIPKLDGEKILKFTRVNENNQSSELKTDKIDQATNLGTFREIRNNNFTEGQNQNSIQTLNKTLSEPNINEISTIKSGSNKETSTETEIQDKAKINVEKPKEKIRNVQGIDTTGKNTQSSLGLDTAAQTPTNQVNNNLQKLPETSDSNSKNSTNDQLQKFLPPKLYFSSLKNLRSEANQRKSLQLFLLNNKSSVVDPEGLKVENKIGNSNEIIPTISRRKSSGEVFSLIRKQCEAKISTPRNTPGSPPNREIFKSLVAEFQMNLKLNENKSEEKVIQLTKSKKIENTKEEFSEKSNEKIEELNKEEICGSQTFVGRRASSHKKSWKFNIRIDLSSPISNNDQIHNCENVCSFQEKSPNNGKQLSLSPTNNKVPSKENSLNQFDQDSPSPFPKESTDRLSLPETKILSLNSAERSSEPKENVISVATLNIKENEDFNTRSYPTLININGRKYSGSAFSPTKGSDENVEGKSPKLSAEEKRKRNKRSNTSDINQLLSPNLVPSVKTTREQSPKSSVAIDYITSYRNAQQKISILNNKGKSVRDLNLLRSIMKETENNVQTDSPYNNRNTSIFSGKSKSPKGDMENSKSKLFKSEQNSFNYGFEQSPSSLANVKSATVQSNFKNPGLKKTFTQKSVFAKKKIETKQIDPFKIAVEFEKKEGNTESLFLNFKGKKKKIKQQLQRRTSSNFSKLRPARSSSDHNILLQNLKQLSSGEGKDSPLALPYKIKLGEQELLTKPETIERQKTLDFSALLEEASRVYPPSGFSRTGSMKSDVHILLGQSTRERVENHSLKLVIKILPPEENSLVERRLSGTSKNNQADGSKKFEYNLRRLKHKKSFDHHDLLFPNVDNFDDFETGNIDMEMCLGNTEKISKNFNWQEQAAYFSQKDEYVNFLRHFEMITSQNQPLLANVYENKIQTYGQSVVSDDFKPNKSRLLKRIISNQTAAPKLNFGEFFLKQNNEDKINAFKDNLKNNSQIAEIKVDLQNRSNPFIEDVPSYDVLSTQRLKMGLEYSAQSIKLLKPLKNHQHIISQIDDRVQAKIFESTGHTVEEYMMLNGLNMQQLSQHCPFSKISEILAKTSIQNLKFTSKLLSKAYSWLLLGTPEFIYFVKTLDSPRIQVFFFFKYFFFFFLIKNFRVK